MKRFIVLVLVVIGMAATSMAQNPSRDPKSRPTKEQVAQRMTDRLTQQLQLTPEQQREVYDAQLHQVGQMHAHREAMRKERQGEDARMKEILTPEQYEKWSNMQGPCPRDGKCGKCDQREKCNRPCKQAGANCNENGRTNR